MISQKTLTAVRVSRAWDPDPPRQSCRTGEHLLSASEGARASGVENLPLSPGGRWVGSC